jgi:hypothetical protein
MRLDISKLDMGIEYARDAAIHILAWRRTLLTHSNYPADTLWTALVLASYRTRDWISHPSDTIDSWALMLVSREPHRRYRDGHWFFYARGSFHGPPVSYSVMHHAPTIQDLDSLLDRAYTPFFTGEYTLRPGLRSGVRDSILEGHIMTEAWEEVFGEPPTYRFDLPPPRKE